MRCSGKREQAGARPVPASYEYYMVAQARVELATPASSGQRSTDELPGHRSIIRRKRLAFHSIMLTKSFFRIGCAVPNHGQRYWSCGSVQESDPEYWSLSAGTGLQVRIDANAADEDRR